MRTERLSRDPSSHSTHPHIERTRSLVIAVVVLCASDSKAEPGFQVWPLKGQASKCNEDPKNDFPKHLRRLNERLWWN